MFDDFCPSADEEPSQTRFLATLRTWPSHARTSSQRPVSQMKLGDLGGYDCYDFPVYLIFIYFQVQMSSPFHPFSSQVYFFFEGPSSPSTTVMTALAVQQLTLSLSNCHVQRFTMEVSPFLALPEALQANSLLSDFDAILNFEATMGMKMAPGILRPATAFRTWVSTRFSQIQS